ncbi:short-chain dehydrogenase [Methylobacterium indicum]|nr:short-chain dehydrogenase [Methylobacterium indicum]KTS42588.1 short-chain dehydrogenase [Methylobacterium indicum]KTS50309.1 short-chain dehydrogenase [Methylobacterium indicum]
MRTNQARRVVVTGAADGIGLACCETLRREGWNVVMVDVDGERLAERASRLGAPHHVVDVTDADALSALADALEHRDPELGPIEGLVNSAGIVQKPLPPELLPLAEYDRVIAVDQRGTYLSCVAFGRHMAARRRGSIVNIASITGMRSVPLHAYGPAKAAVIATGECLAAEWGPSGVRVNTVSPGYTFTERVRRRVETGERALEHMTGTSALGRVVQPSEIADAVSFLLSNRSSAITGVNIPVDCGWLLAPSWSTYGGLRHPV